MKTINSMTGELAGTVESTPQGLLWHLPMQDVYFGASDMQPATWIDEKGQEQIAVIKTNAWGLSDVALDRDRTFGYADAYLDISEVQILKEQDGYTTQIQYPIPAKLLPNLENMPKVFREHEQGIAPPLPAPTGAEVGKSIVSIGIVLPILIVLLILYFIFKR